MEEIIQIAAAHNISAETLSNSLTAQGWDFTPFDRSIPEMVTFVTRTIAITAERIAKIEATKAARVAKIEAHRAATMTPAAKASPALVCYKCDGKGRVYGFSHIQSGVCFACQGVGIRRKHT